ncbi:50S ribosomal protein L4 [Candidatus Bathyarchaeota archaeon]|nr:MAG: 50S ribosomal protein L4 [Candidatus Bathyarchaeota archaeon]RLI04747.1 MAG: 50S ribosomal protein L4 [Candidatus Bathyarchaeota archaeon]
MSKASASVFNLEGKKVGRIKLPSVFNTSLRPDVIKKAVVAIQTHRIQPQGRDVMAGKRTTAESWGVGHGIARIPRLKESRRAALAPGTVGGRQAHPPVVEKKIRKKIPKKERRLALFSAIAATGSKEIVAERGHIIDEVPELPLVVTDDLQNLKRTQEVKDVFISLGVWPDIYRVKESIKIRAGRGKMRGRRKKVGVGPLIVISENGGIIEASRNLPGVDVAYVKDLNPELLAPGTHPGRLTVWTRSSIEELRRWDGGK